MGGFDDGNALLKDCTSRNPFAQGLCYGLITGYFEGMRMSYTCSKDDPNINREQVKDVVIKFLKNTPEARHLPGVLLASRAFVLAFDCKPNSK